MRKKFIIPIKLLIADGIAALATGFCKYVLPKILGVNTVVTITTQAASKFSNVPLIGDLLNKLFGSTLSTSVMQGSAALVGKLYNVSCTVLKWLLLITIIILVLNVLRRFGKRIKERDSSVHSVTSVESSSSVVQNVPESSINNADTSKMDVF